MESRRAGAFKSRGPIGDIKRLMKADEARSHRKSERRDRAMKRRNIDLGRSPLCEIQEERKSNQESKTNYSEEEKKLAERLVQWKKMKALKKRQTALARQQPFVLVGKTNVIPKTPPLLPKVGRRKGCPDVETVEVSLRRSVRLQGKLGAAQPIAKPAVRVELATCTKRERTQARKMKTGRHPAAKGDVNSNNNHKVKASGTTKPSAKDSVVICKPTRDVQSFESQLESNLNKGLSLVEFSRKKPFSPFQFSFQPTKGQADVVNPYEKACNGIEHTPPVEDLSWLKHVTVTRPVNGGASSPAFLNACASPEFNAPRLSPQSPKQQLVKDSAPSNGCVDASVSAWLHTKRGVVAPFRQTMKSETHRLQSLCSKWSAVEEQEKDLTEEVVGMIKTAVGKAQLLISQRFSQFSQLCDVSEDPSASKTVEVSDLEGFWDMVQFQVDDVTSQFESLDKLQANHWEMQEEKKVAKKQGRKKTKGLKKTEQSNRPYATRSRQIQEFKAKMLAAKKFHQKDDDLPFEIVGASNVGDVPFTSQTPSPLANKELHNRAALSRLSLSCKMSAGKHSARRNSLRTSVLKSAHKQNARETSDDCGHSVCPSSTPPALAFNLTDYTLPCQINQPVFGISTSLDTKEDLDKMSALTSADVVPEGHRSCEQQAVCVNTSDKAVETDDGVSGMISEFKFSRKGSTAIAGQRGRQSLMVFSPDTTAIRKSTTTSYGSAKKLAQVTPSKRIREEYDTSIYFFSPVRRAIRLSSFSTTRRVVDREEDLPDGCKYMPNKLVDNL